jgi:hypothetical protein
MLTAEMVVLLVIVALVFFFFGAMLTMPEKVTYNRPSINGLVSLSTTDLLNVMLQEDPGNFMFTAALDLVIERNAKLNEPLGESFQPTPEVEQSHLPD